MDVPHRKSIGKRILTNLLCLTLPIVWILIIVLTEDTKNDRVYKDTGRYESSETVDLK